MIKAKLATAGAGLRAAATRARSTALTLGSLGAMTASAYVGLGLWAGLLAGGLSLAALEYLTTPDGDEVAR